MPSFATITELAPKIRSGEISPVTLAEQALADISNSNGTLNAVRMVCADRALAAAHAAETQINAGIYLGPLHGIPYLTKDIFDVAGLPTTAGSLTREDHCADDDSWVTNRLAQAGMVLIGKTNTVEFAFGSVGVNHSHGTPRNPWHAEHHVPGGSSSGSAVSVAAGIVPLAMGSDTACSVRGPAALCGVAGLKTTIGRISRHGVYPLSTTLDSIGPLTRSVRDAALVLMALQGADPNDPATQALTDVDALARLDRGVSGLRLGFAESALFANLDPEVESAVRASGPLFESLGAQVKSFEFPLADEALALPAAPSMVEGCIVNAQHLDQRLERMDPVVAQRMLLGREVSAIDYASSLLALPGLRRRATEAFAENGIDAILAPTTMIPALPLATVDADLATYMHYAGAYMRNCYVGNLLDLTAVTLPCGFNAAGLPIGLMVYAPSGREDIALQVAHGYEQATDWLGRAPPHG